MTYIDGFVTAVPSAAKDAYLAHAREAQRLFAELGVTRMTENWGDAVPDGTITDFARAVRRRDDETVVFSWFEYPDRATRDAAAARMRADDRLAAMIDTMPFDGRRMIHGGFAVIVEEGAGAGGYVDGFVAPVSPCNRDAYRAEALRTAALFREHGALRVVEAWQDDVPVGEITDFRRAVLAEGDEAVVFAWIEWPDRATRMAGWEALANDPRMAPPGEAPFDGKRMIYGGFAALPLNEQE